MTPYDTFFAAMKALAIIGSGASLRVVQIAKRRERWLRAEIERQRHWSSFWRDQERWLRAEIERQRHWSSFWRDQAKEARGELEAERAARSDRTRRGNVTRKQPVIAKLHEMQADVSEGRVVKMRERAA